MLASGIVKQYPRSIVVAPEKSLSNLLIHGSNPLVFHIPALLTALFARLGASAIKDSPETTSDSELTALQILKVALNPSDATAYDVTLFYRLNGPNDTHKEVIKISRVELDALCAKSGTVLTAAASQHFAALYREFSTPSADAEHQELNKLIDLTHLLVPDNFSFKRDAAPSLPPPPEDKGITQLFEDTGASMDTVRAGTTFKRHKIVNQTRLGILRELLVGDALKRYEKTLNSQLQANTSVLGVLSRRNTQTRLQIVNSFRMFLDVEPMAGVSVLPHTPVELVDSFLEKIQANTSDIELTNKLTEIIEDYIKHSDDDDLLRFYYEVRRYEMARKASRLKAKDQDVSSVRITLKSALRPDWQILNSADNGLHKPDSRQSLLLALNTALPGMKKNELKQLVALHVNTIQARLVNTFNKAFGKQHYNPAFANVFTDFDFRDIADLQTVFGDSDLVTFLRDALEIITNLQINHAQLPAFIESYQILFGNIQTATIVDAEIKESLNAIQVALAAYRQLADWAPLFDEYLTSENPLAVLPTLVAALAQRYLTLPSIEQAYFAHRLVGDIIVKLSQYTYSNDSNLAVFSYLTLEAVIACASIQVLDTPYPGLLQQVFAVAAEDAKLLLSQQFTTTCLRWIEDANSSRAAKPRKPLASYRLLQESGLLASLAPEDTMRIQQAIVDSACAQADLTDFKAMLAEAELASIAAPQGKRDLKTLITRAATQGYHLDELIQLHCDNNDDAEIFGIPEAKYSEFKLEIAPLLALAVIKRIQQLCAHTAEDITSQYQQIAAPLGDERILDLLREQKQFLHAEDNQVHLTELTAAIKNFCTRHICFLITQNDTDTLATIYFNTSALPSAVDDPLRLDIDFVSVAHTALDEFISACPEADKENHYLDIFYAEWRLELTRCKEEEEEDANRFTDYLEYLRGRFSAYVPNSSLSNIAEITRVVDATDTEDAADIPDTSAAASPLTEAALTILLDNLNESLPLRLAACLPEAVQAILERQVAAICQAPTETEHSGTELPTQIQVSPYRLYGLRILLTQWQALRQGLQHLGEAGETVAEGTQLRGNYLASVNEFEAPANFLKLFSVELNTLRNLEIPLSAVADKTGLADDPDTLVPEFRNKVSIALSALDYVNKILGYPDNIKPEMPAIKAAFTLERTLAFGRLRHLVRTLILDKQINDPIKIALLSSLEPLVSAYPHELEGHTLLLKLVADAEKTVADYVVAARLLSYVDNTQASSTIIIEDFHGFFDPDFPVKLCELLGDHEFTQLATRMHAHAHQLIGTQPDLAKAQLASQFWHDLKPRWESKQVYHFPEKVGTYLNEHATGLSAVDLATALIHVEEEMQIAVLQQWLYALSVTEDDANIEYYVKALHDALTLFPNYVFIANTGVINLTNCGLENLDEIYAVIYEKLDILIARNTSGIAKQLATLFAVKYPDTDIDYADFIEKYPRFIQLAIALNQAIFDGGIGISADSLNSQVEEFLKLLSLFAHTNTQELDTLKATVAHILQSFMTAFDAFLSRKHKTKALKYPLPPHFIFATCAALSRGFGVTDFTLWIEHNGILRTTLGHICESYSLESKPIPSNLQSPLHFSPEFLQGDSSMSSDFDKLCLYFLAGYSDPFIPASITTRISSLTAVLAGQTMGKLKLTSKILLPNDILRLTQKVNQARNNFPQLLSDETSDTNALLEIIEIEKKSNPAIGKVGSFFCPEDSASLLQTAMTHSPFPELYGLLWLKLDDLAQRFLRKVDFHFIPIPSSNALMRVLNSMWSSVYNTSEAFAPTTWSIIQNALTRIIVTFPPSTHLAAHLDIEQAFELLPLIQQAFSRLYRVQLAFSYAERRNLAFYDGDSENGFAHGTFKPLCETIEAIIKKLTSLTVDSVNPNNLDLGVLDLQAYLTNLTLFISAERELNSDLPIGSAASNLSQYTLVAMRQHYLKLRATFVINALAVTTRPNVAIDSLTERIDGQLSSLCQLVEANRFSFDDAMLTEINSRLTTLAEIYQTTTDKLETRQIIATLSVFIQKQLLDRLAKTKKLDAIACFSCYPNVASVVAMHKFMDHFLFWVEQLHTGQTPAKTIADYLAMNIFPEAPCQFIVGPACIPLLETSITTPRTNLVSCFDPALAIYFKPNLEELLQAMRNHNREAFASAYQRLLTQTFPNFMALLDLISDILYITEHATDKTMDTSALDRDYAPILLALSPRNLPPLFTQEWQLYINCVSRQFWKILEKLASPGLKRLYLDSPEASRMAKFFENVAPDQLERFNNCRRQVRDEIEFKYLGEKLAHFGSGTKSANIDWLKVLEERRQDVAALATSPVPSIQGYIKKHIREAHKRLVRHSEKIITGKFQLSDNDAATARYQRELALCDYLYCRIFQGEFSLERPFQPITSGYIQSSLAKLARVLDTSPRAAATLSQLSFSDILPSHNYITYLGSSLDRNRAYLLFYQFFKSMPSIHRSGRIGTSYAYDSQAQNPPRQSAQFAYDLMNYISDGEIFAVRDNQGHTIINGQGILTLLTRLFFNSLFALPTDTLSGYLAENARTLFPVMEDMIRHYISPIEFSGRLMNFIRPFAFANIDDWPPESVKTQFYKWLVSKFPGYREIILTEQVRHQLVLLIKSKPRNGLCNMDMHFCFKATPIAERESDLLETKLHDLYQLLKQTLTHLNVHQQSFLRDSMQDYFLNDNFKYYLDQIDRDVPFPQLKYYVFVFRVLKEVNPHMAEDIRTRVAGTNARPLHS